MKVYLFYNNSLQIYTPEIGLKNLPVMFWIHGGAFNMGSGNSDM